jgi:LPS sulfotransferase NodH
MSAAPILVTGSAKSGTTWVGEMLAASGQIGYIREPFNPHRPLGISGIVTPYWHMYVPPDLPADSSTGRAMQATLAYRVSLADVWRRGRSR